MVGSQPAVAVDAKQSYAEIALGNLNPGIQTWNAPHTSDWAIAIGDFIENQPPVADAGPDQTVTDSDNSSSEDVILDGSGSSDPDGSIVSYVWTEGVNQIATGVNPTVTLSVGSHNIDLTVTDALGVTDSDTVVITVNSTLIFRVERSTGDVFTRGSFIAGGADLAERISVSEPVQPGDLVELDPNKPRHYRKARGSSKLVAGVITTRPGFTLGNNSEDPQQLNVMTAEKGLRFGAVVRPMLALMGRVPVKATTQNGPIRPGDLLTVSSKPGYAMRCAEPQACAGAIGKALEALERGQGSILVLLMTR
jgi:hypothetical protein